MDRPTLMKLVGAMIVLTIIQSVVLLQFDWFGEAASEERPPIDTLFDVMIVLSAFVFAIVMVMFGYAIWKYKAKPGDESDGEPIHGNTRLEIAWTVIPTIIVLFGAGYSWLVLNDIEAKADDRMQLKVTGQQFAWSFEYPEIEVGSSGSSASGGSTGSESGGTESEPQHLTTTELHVPVDRQLEITLEGLDVIHSFWVPEWGIKRDAVPTGTGGDEVDDTFVVTPDKEGTYSLVCTELCGLGHATMRALVVVHSQEDFDNWVSEQQAQAAGGESGGSESPGGGAS